MTRPDVDYEPYLQAVSKALVLNCILRNTSLSGFVTNEQLATITRECVDNIFTALRYSPDLPDAPAEWPDAAINKAMIQQEQVKPDYIRRGEDAARRALPKMRARRHRTQAEA